MSTGETILTNPKAEIPDEIYRISSLQSACPVLFLQELNDKVIAYQRSEVSITHSCIFSLRNVYFFFLFFFLFHFFIICRFIFRFCPRYHLIFSLRFRFLSRCKFSFYLSSCLLHLLPSSLYHFFSFLSSSLNSSNPLIFLLFFSLLLLLQPSKYHIFCISSSIAPICLVKVIPPLEPPVLIQALPI